MIYIFVNKDEYTKEMNLNADTCSDLENYKVIRFNDYNEVNDSLNEYKRFDKDNYKEIVNSIRNSEIVQNKKNLPPTQSFAIANNKTEDGKVLYAKIFGQKATVQPSDVHEFTYQVPYKEIYFFGAEIMQDIIGVADFTIYHPEYDIDLEEYGQNVNLGTIKYTRETRFAARIPQGLVLKCKYTNDTDEPQEVGVNFLMHEIRDV